MHESNKLNRNEGIAGNFNCAIIHSEDSPETPLAEAGFSHAEHKTGTY